jgi:hypothetical protein
LLSATSPEWDSKLTSIAWCQQAQLSRDEAAGTSGRRTIDTWLR